MSEDRLQKILARAGIASRRKAEELIREGHVTVNGNVAELGEKADPERDSIKVEGKRVQLAQTHRYLLLNKPKGVMSTVTDPEGRRTVIDLVPPLFRKALVPVGRLDFNTEGLLLLTDDGEFAQRIAHPRYGSRKTYEVKVKGRPEEAAVDRLRAGIMLDGRRTAPARITPLPPKAPASRRRAGGTREEGENTWWQVELTEGRTRQIREMFERVGHPVQKLRRVAIGSLRDAKLPVGALRELTEQEVEKLLKSAAGPPKKKAVAKKGEPAAPAAPPAAKRPVKVAIRQGAKPASKKAGPPAKRTAPAAKKAAPAARKSAPPARKKAAAPARKAGPPARKAGSPARKAAAPPRKKAGPPARKKAGPPARKKSGPPTGKNSPRARR
jgi:23S rRNA pseudouridine2605 synthase